MTFCWSSAGRLRPVRMVWLENNYNEPRYELVKWHAPNLRRYPRLGIFRDRESKVENDRWMRLHSPGGGKMPKTTKKRRRK